MNACTESYQRYGLHATRDLDEKAAWTAHLHGHTVPLHRLPVNGDRCTENTIVGRILVGRLRHLVGRDTATQGWVIKREPTQDRDDLHDRSSTPPRYGHKLVATGPFIPETDTEIADREAPQRRPLLWFAVVPMRPWRYPRF